MNVINAIILCLVSYPCIVAWVIGKKRFVHYILLALVTCLGGIFSYVLYKQPDYPLTIEQAIILGYAVLSIPAILVFGVVNLFLRMQAGMFR